MLKTDLIEYLQEQLNEDIIYTETAFDGNDERHYVKCSIFSASAGYSMDYTREISSVNNRNVQKTREKFLIKLHDDIDKFVPRFDYTDDPLEGLDVLFNDGFVYEEFM